MLSGWIFRSSRTFNRDYPREESAMMMNPSPKSPSSPQSPFLHSQDVRSRLPDTSNEDKGQNASVLNRGRRRNPWISDVRSRKERIERKSEKRGFPKMTRIVLMTRTVVAPANANVPVSRRCVTFHPSPRSLRARSLRPSRLILLLHSFDRSAQTWVTGTIS